jgi:hypothetical protein
MINDLLDTLNITNGVSPNQVNIDYKPGKEHISIKHDIWTMSGWRENDVQFNKNHIIDDIERIENELLNDIINKKNTTARPIYFENADNVLTLIGLTESAKRDTGEVSTTLTHNSIGTDGTTATSADTDLNTEDSGGSYARQAYASAGQRKVTSQTAKYGMLWTDSVISAAPLSIQESGIHWHVSDPSKMHARVTFTTFSMTAGDLFVTQINELHQNG